MFPAAIISGSIIFLSYFPNIINFNLLILNFNLENNSNISFILLCLLHAAETIITKSSSLRLSSFLKFFPLLEKISSGTELFIIILLRQE